MAYDIDINYTETKITRHKPGFDHINVCFVYVYFLQVTGLNIKPSLTMDKLSLSRHMLSKPLLVILFIFNKQDGRQDR